MITQYSKTKRAGLRLRLLGCTALLALAAAPAFAQDPAPAPTGEAAATDDGVIVLRGIRKGLQDAITAKKRSSSIIEAVSAEDIGKLPDSSIAESIARLPGIAAQRDKGRAQTLSIRGLGPDFTVTTLNGREQASTNDNRSVEYDQYPSEMIQQVRVFKTPDASMTFQGLAGTADLQTVKPLSYARRSLSVMGKLERNSQDEQVPGQPTSGERLNLSYVDSFKDKTIGVALGLSHSKTPYQAQTHEPWGYPTYSDGNMVIGGDKSGIQSSYYERDSVMGVLELKPNDQFHATFDLFHSDFHELQTIRRLEYGTVWGSGALQPGYTVEDGRITKGTFNGVTTIVENYTNDRNASIDNFGANLVFKPSDKWTLEADLSSSKVERSDLRLESTAGTGAAGSVVRDNLSFETVDDGVIQLGSTLDYSDFDHVYLTDPGGWGSPLYRAGYVGNPEVKDEISAIKLAATRVFSDGPFRQVSAGINLTDRKKNKHQWQGELRNKTAAAMKVPEAFRTGTVDTSFWGNPNGMISYDALGLYRSGFWNVVDARVDPAANTGDRIFDITQTWEMQEQLTTLFVKADIDTTVFGVPVTGNVGIQSITADQEANQGFTNGATVAGDPTKLIVTQVKDGEKYTDILPSLNLNFSLPNDISLRVAAATTMARPRMDDMAGGTSYNVAADTAPPYVNGNITYYWGAGGGNPHLKPWKANAYDISFEKYFGRKGYVSMAAYYKELTSYIYYQSVATDFTGFPLPTPAGNYTRADANRNGYTGAQANGDGGGFVRGVEFTASIPGDLIHENLDGFGFIFSAALNNSKITPDGIHAVPLPGLSPKVINTTLYYEKRGFSARISQRYREAWLGQVPNFDSSLGSQWVDEETVVDAQVGYNFEDGPLKGLSLNLSAYNLTDQPFRYYAGENQTQNILKYENYGTTYLVSVGYRFY
ncbi:TonB-dependent receptor [Asticcacaulis sp. AC460]|uniref:TonB-dependent receptor n=1 Tax=Asticcacaulis sp. AC460 TaxID=1282360 RepID=UPI000411E77F|nr:TonB-dependent receptor [Asticcacaulis sp. AC460]